jgi:HAD superfamily hydrolase (TIGR01509 family)
VTARAVTFDFHNTIAECDAWFQLEVRHLVSAFLTWEVRSSGTTPSPDFLTTVDASYRRLRQSVIEHGNELPAERCIATVLSQFGLEVDLATVARGVDDLMREALPSATPMMGAIDTIRALSREGIPLGIVSSAVHHPFLEWTLERFGIREAFAVVTTSASAGYYKSRPEIYRQTLDLLDADPTHSIHVGDSRKFDVGGAQRAGMRTVLISADEEESGRDGPIPDLVLPSLQNAAPRIMCLLATAR